MSTCLKIEGLMSENCVFPFESGPRKYTLPLNYEMALHQSKANLLCLRNYVLKSIFANFIFLLET